MWGYAKLGILGGNLSGKATGLTILPMDRRLRARFSIKNEDDGEFSMPYEACLKEDASTTFTVEENAEKYKHSQLIRDFRNCKYELCGFTLKNAIDPEVSCFAISVAQQGGRLKNAGKGVLLLMS